MDFDEAEWVVADRADFAAGDADWVIEDGCEDDATSDERRRSISGVIFRSSSSGRPAFAPFDPRSRAVRDLSLSFLPPSLTVVAACNGLVLLRGPWSSYYICNPATSDLASLPRPSYSHFRSTAALVFKHSAQNPKAEFHVVCALDSSGPYHFETFSSATQEWRVAAPEVPRAGAIVPASGISADGSAYWRTTEGTVVGFDPESDTARVFAQPDGNDSASRWQLGEAGGRLCCTVVKPSTMDFHAFGPSDRWLLLGSIGIIAGETGAEEWDAGEAIVCEELPWPLRFQSGDPEALLLIGRRVVGVGLTSGRIRMARIEGVPRGDDAYDCVSHINTVAPVHQQMMPNRRR